MLRTDRMNVTPLNDPATAVVAGMDTGNVDTVLIAGRVMKRDGKLLHVDWPAVQKDGRSSLATTSSRSPASSSRRSEFGPAARLGRRLWSADVFHSQPRPSPGRRVRRASAGHRTRLGAVVGRPDLSRTVARRLRGRESSSTGRRWKISPCGRKRLRRPPAKTGLCWRRSRSPVAPRRSSFDWQPELEWVNHTTGIVSLIFIFLPRFPLVTVEHGERYLEKVRRLPDFIDVWADRLESAAGEGLTPIAHLVTAMIASLDRQLAAPLSEGPLIRQPPPTDAVR